MLPYRVDDGTLEVLIAHMGGPFWAKKDDGAWSVIKGEHDEGDDPVEAARREWVEETGTQVPYGELVPLGEVRQRSGKRVNAWAVHSPRLNPDTFVSNTFKMEWPPNSGRMESFPEIDRAAWMDVETAAVKLVAAQRPLLAALAKAVGVSPPQLPAGRG